MMDGVPEHPGHRGTGGDEHLVSWTSRRSGPENIVATVHNIYTLRGALVRDALEWSRQINKALYLFGHEAEVMFASHSWPRWGNERIREVMRTQRDAYAHLNNGVMHPANQGVTINEIHRVYQVPESLQRNPGRPQLPRLGGTQLAP